MNQCTLVLLMKNDQVLLGYKMRGFGKGNYLGVGGKVEPQETITQAAIREVEEEIKVKASNLKQVGDFSFIFPHKQDWNQRVHVFTSVQWTGEIQATEEMTPKWFNQNDLPYPQMWDDALFWMPAILGGYKLQGKFVFSPKLKVVKVKLESLNKNLS